MRAATADAAAIQPAGPVRCVARASCGRGMARPAAAGAARPIVHRARRRGPRQGRRAPLACGGARDVWGSSWRLLGHAATVRQSNGRPRAYAARASRGQPQPSSPAGPLVLDASDAATCGGRAIAHTYAAQPREARAFAVRPCAPACFRACRCRRRPRRDDARQRERRGGASGRTARAPRTRRCSAPHPSLHRLEPGRLGAASSLRAATVRAGGHAPPGCRAPRLARLSRTQPLWSRRPVGLHGGGSACGAASGEAISQLALHGPCQLCRSLRRAPRIGLGGRPRAGERQLPLRRSALAARLRGLAPQDGHTVPRACAAA